MIRYAILAAVSTQDQTGPDKKSIDDQIATVRRTLNAQGAEEAGGPYILDGYSRSGYENLSDAINDIPPLAQALEESSKWDVMAVDNWDRLGDLAPMLRTRFKKLKKQLYSARQSGKLVGPEDYDPYSDDVTDISMHVEGIIQSYRINKLRRAWAVGIPARVQRGLHPVGERPYAYRLTTKDEPYELVPEQAALLVQMKDWFLAGKPLVEICALADETHVRPRRAGRWHGEVVRRMLTNPVYAGQIVLGRTSGKNKVKQPPSKWVTGQGKHVPLWDEKTYFAILNELDRRVGRKAPADYNSRYALSGLLTCSVCHKKLHRGSSSGNGARLYCQKSNGHISVGYEVAVNLVAEKIARELENIEVASSGDDGQAALDALREKRQRVQDGYERGIYTEIEAAGRLTELETEMSRLEKKQQREAARLDNLDVAKALHGFGKWMLHGDPREVNRLLSALCEVITISPELELQVYWR